jgi:hypothetical protein
MLSLIGFPNNFFASPATKACFSKPRKGSSNVTEAQQRRAFFKSN